MPGDIAQTPGAAVAELSREWLTALDTYVQGFKEEALKAGGVAVDKLLKGVQERAAITPGWDGMVDNIEVWSDDGILTIGVQDEAFVSQAFALEYGDEIAPPNPLFRTITNVVNEAGDAYVDHLANVGYR